MADLVNMCRRYLKYVCPKAARRALKYVQQDRPSRAKMVPKDFRTCPKSQTYEDLLSISKPKLCRNSDLEGFLVEFETKVVQKSELERFLVEFDAKVAQKYRTGLVLKAKVAHKSRTRRISHRV